MQFDQLKRREFISLLGGAATWPLAARAQQSERMRRIGMLMTLAAGDPIGQARVATFAQGLQQLGWTIGRNVQLDVRWPGAEADDARQIRSRTGDRRPGRDRGQWQYCGRAFAAGDPQRADRVHYRPGPFVETHGEAAVLARSERDKFRLCDVSAETNVQPLDAA
jgi:hypothetical protein